MAIAGCALMTIIILVSLAAPLLTPYDPTLMDVTQKALPFRASICSARIAWAAIFWQGFCTGGRVSILIGLVSAAGASLIGVVLGCISGYYGGAVDKVLLYISELFMTFPRTLLVLLCVGLAGQSTANIIWSSF